MEKAPTSQLDEYGDWMIVTRRKSVHKARDKLKGPSGSQTGESSQMPYDKTLPRTGEIDKAAGKRKAPHFQTEKCLRTLCLIRKSQLMVEVQIEMELVPTLDKKTKLPLEIKKVSWARARIRVCLCLVPVQAHQRMLG